MPYLVSHPNPLIEIWESKHIIIDAKNIYNYIPMSDFGQGKLICVNVTLKPLLFLPVPNHIYMLHRLHQGQER